MAMRCLVVAATLVVISAVAPPPNNVLKASDMTDDECERDCQPCKPHDCDSVCEKYGEKTKGIRRVMCNYKKARCETSNAKCLKKTAMCEQKEAKCKEEKRNKTPYPQVDTAWSKAFSTSGYHTVKKADSDVVKTATLSTNQPGHTSTFSSECPSYKECIGYAAKAEIRCPPDDLKCERGKSKDVVTAQECADRMRNCLDQYMTDKAEISTALAPGGRLHKFAAANKN